MSVDRRPNVKPPFDGQPGRCCWCGGALTGRRTRWCGDKCVHEYQLARGDQGRARALLFERDAGKCALCGATGRAWDADHVVPIAEGGALALSNLRTLCTACHRAETRKLAARLAARRREAAVAWVKARAPSLFEGSTG